MVQFDEDGLSASVLGEYGATVALAAGMIRPFPWIAKLCGGHVAGRMIVVGGATTI